MIDTSKYMLDGAAQVKAEREAKVSLLRTAETPAAYKEAFGGDLAKAGAAYCMDALGYSDFAALDAAVRKYCAEHKKGVINKMGEAIEVIDLPIWIGGSALRYAVEQGKALGSAWYGVALALPKCKAEQLNELLAPSAEAEPEKPEKKAKKAS